MSRRDNRPDWLPPQSTTPRAYFRSRAPVILTDELGRRRIRCLRRRDSQPVGTTEKSHGAHEISPSRGSDGQLGVAVTQQQREDDFIGIATTVSRLSPREVMFTDV